MRLNEENYVDLAEEAIRKLCKKTDRSGRAISIVTTSKIRNLLAMTADIYNDALNEKGEGLSGDIVARINYLKVRFVYEAGREPAVKNLVEEAEILEHLDEVKGNKSRYLLFSRYMEALVAYRKFYGGRDE